MSLNTCNDVQRLKKLWLPLFHTHFCCICTKSALTRINLLYSIEICRYISKMEAIRRKCESGFSFGQVRNIFVNSAFTAVSPRATITRLLRVDNAVLSYASVQKCSFQTSTISTKPHVFRKRRAIQQFGFQWLLRIKNHVR